MTKFVYFDLGGVVVNDFSGTNKWNDFLKELGIKKEQEKEFDIFWGKYEAQASVGRDIETLISLINERFSLKISSNYSLLMDGFINRFEKNRSIWPVISEFHKYFKVGLLTNMYPGMLNAIAQNELMPDTNWDVIIDSSLEGLSKPPKNI